MDYEKLKEVIAKKIKENGREEITGPVLQMVLMAMVDSLGEVYPHTYTEEQKAQARANIDALSDHNGEITKEKLSADVQAILNDVANKQNITDESLATIAKTIVGAINEVYNGGLKDASIATSKIEDGAITEPKLATDLVNVITSAVQPAELASALASYVAKTDIVDTTGSATDKVMSQHGVTEAINGVTNKVTELEVKLGINEQHTYTSEDFFGLAFNDSDKTFKDFVELGFNGILIPIKKGASYSLESSEEGIVSIILLNEVPYVGLTLQNDKLKFPFVNTDNYKYLYITVKTTSFQGLSLREKLDGIEENVENLLTLPIRVDSLEDKIGYDKSATYTSENFYGFYWNGTKFLAASSSYNGILVPLKSGVDYTLVGNSTSKIILNALPIGDSGDMLVRTIGGTTFRAEEGELYLFVTIPVSSFSSFVVNSKLGGLTEKAERIDILDEEIGYAKNTIIKKEDCYGFYWNGTKFVESGSSAYDGVLVPLVEGSECSFGADANGVISKIIITGLPPTGTLARESPRSFVVGENEKYLYVTINKNSYNDDLTFLSTKQGIARNTMFLEKRFGQSLVKGKKALFFGDSITCVNTINEDGTLTLRKYNWSKLAAIDLELEDYIYAQDGARWTDDSDLTQYQKASEQITLAMSKHDTADIVILSLGTNNWGTNNDTFEDAMSKTSLASLDRTKIHQAIRWCLWTLRDKYKTARFFVFLPLQRAGYTQKSEIFTSISKMAEVYGCYVFDQFSEVGICHVNEVQNGNGTYLADGLHPNQDGKELQARYAVKKILESYIEP